MKARIRGMCLVAMITGLVTEPAIELFLEFYRQLWTHDLPVNEALAVAKRHLREHPDHPEWSHPAYWAAWVIYGAY